MAAINPLSRELVLKIVFYGPGLGGKTTTLQHVHDMARPEHRGKMVSLATAVDRTLYFDFLPIRVPKTRGMSVRLQLFTVPGQVYYNSTRKLVLTGADGIVFVADSQAARADANLESLENLLENLRDQKRDLEHVPHIIQYNKRDLPDVLPVEELERSLNLFKVPSIETVATRGDGVFETLGLITKAAMNAFNETMPAPSGSAEFKLAIAEGGLSEALRGAEPQPSARAILTVTENVIDSARPSRLTNFPESGEALVESSPTTPAPAPEHEARETPKIEPPPAPPSPPAAAGDERPEGWGSPRIPSGITPLGFSFAGLWGEGERELVREAEQALGARELARAIDVLDALATRVLASAGALLGSSEAPRDPAVVPVLLGVSGARYLAFRALVRDARAGIEPDERAALAAYAFVIELRLARTRVGV